MAILLRGAINSVPVNSSYPVNGSVYEIHIPGVGSGEEICIPFEDRSSEVLATEVLEVLFEDRSSTVLASNHSSEVGPGVVIIIAAEDRSSTILAENRNTDINARDEC